MARLNISPSELRSRASELESQRQQHLQTMQRLRVCINNLPDIWQGAAADEFIQKFASANNQFNSFSDTLEKYIQLIQKAALITNCFLKFIASKSKHTNVFI